MARPRNPLLADKNLANVSSWASMNTILTDAVAEHETEQRKFLRDELPRGDLRHCENLRRDQPGMPRNTPRFRVACGPREADGGAETNVFGDDRRYDGEVCSTRRHGYPIRGGGLGPCATRGWRPRSASRRVGSFARPPCGAAMVRENDGGARATSLLKLSRSCVP